MNNKTKILYGSIISLLFFFMPVVSGLIITDYTFITTTSNTSINFSSPTNLSRIDWDSIYINLTNMYMNNTLYYYQDNIYYISYEADNTIKNFSLSDGKSYIVTSVPLIPICTYNLVYGAWSEWSNSAHSCGTRTREYNDSNYATCCAVGGTCYADDTPLLQQTYTQTQTENCKRSGVPINGLLLFMVIIIACQIFGLIYVFSNAQKLSSPANMVNIILIILTLMVSIVILVGAL